MLVSSHDTIDEARAQAQLSDVEDAERERVTEKGNQPSPRREVITERGEMGTTERRFPDRIRKAPERYEAHVVRRK